MAWAYLPERDLAAPARVCRMGTPGREAAPRLRVNGTCHFSPYHCFLLSPEGNVRNLDGV